MKIKTGVKIGNPAGSYQQSCEDISYDPETRMLTATCYWADWSYDQDSSVYVPLNYTDILNCDGYLDIDYCSARW